MSIALKVSIDAGSPLSITAAPTVILQGTNSAGKPTRIIRVELQSNNTGATQQSIPVSLGFYATGTSSGGSARTPVPCDEGITGYTPATAFYANTTTMGTTFTNKKTWQWLTCNPFDEVDGLEEIQDEFPVSKVWAIILPVPPVAFFLTGTLRYKEFG